MTFDLTSLETAINELKSNISNAYNACITKKATSIPTNKNSANLAQCILSIPTGSSGGDTPVISEAITAGSFSGFNVTVPEATENDDGELVYPNEVTLAMGSVGVTFTSLVCFSNTNDGYFSITKLPNNMCIVSSHVFNRYNDESQTGVIDTNGSAKTFRASYNISGNSIKLVLNAFPNQGTIGTSDSEYFRAVADQVATNEWGYFSNYPLELITITT